MFIELFEDMLLHPTLDSSVGRAEDCRCSNELQISLGHWFESGSREKLFFPLSRKINIGKMFANFSEQQHFVTNCLSMPKYCLLLLASSSMYPIVVKCS